MADAWTPSLCLRETARGCRLSLGGLAHGEGATLQDACDDLVGRVLSLAMGMRSGGPRVALELGPPDHRWWSLLWDVGEIAARGEDIRPRLFRSG